MGVCDISADIEGSIQFTDRFTTIEEPFLAYNVKTGKFHSPSQLTKNSILFHSIDYLPAEIPKEASKHFGNQLIPFVRKMATSNFDLPFEK